MFKLPGEDAAVIPVSIKEYAELNKAAIDGDRAKLKKFAGAWVEVTGFVAGFDHSDTLGGRAWGHNVVLTAEKGDYKSGLVLCWPEELAPWRLMSLGDKVTARGVAQPGGIFRSQFSGLEKCTPAPTFAAATLAAAYAKDPQKMREKHDRKWSVVTGPLAKPFDDRDGAFKVSGDVELAIEGNALRRLHFQDLKGGDNVTVVGRLQMSAGKITIAEAFNPDLPAPSLNQKAAAAPAVEPASPDDSTKPADDPQPTKTRPKPAAARQWTSADGKFKVAATLVKVDDEGVHLKKSDGKIVVVPREKLSETDQKYLGARE